ncbi:MAG: 5-bromo-4-chloroindolyl phosphate hydrolysis family protein, partial [Lachnospiraceae bacterium]|nr:5-bromo-4-chloroindolyl phosphate hydrolysis family protein [Lachnospiraceae bacterium]
MKQDSGLMGMFGLIGGITLLLVARRYVPDLANLILLLIGVCGVLLIILVSVVLYFALKKPKKTEEQKASDEINDIIKSGRKNLMGLRRMSMEIKHARARTLSTEICVTIERIFRTLKEKPDQISSLRPFFNYYLPTLEKILIKYKEIESSGVPT